MTALDPPPPLRCPACGEGDRINPSQPVERHLGRWTCYRCWLWFWGGADEWAHYQPHRDARQRKAEN